MINSEQQQMKKIRSLHLPKVRKNQQMQQPDLEKINEYAAQQSLFQISKLEQSPINPHQQFIQELSRHTASQKREQRSSLSLPRKKEIPQIPPLDLKTFRQTFLQQNSNLESIGLTNYVVIDNRKHKRDCSKHSEAKSERNSLYEQINRKAKYLFRARNKSKAQRKGQSLFKQSFYCYKIKSMAAEEN